MLQRMVAQDVTSYFLELLTIKIMVALTILILGQSEQPLSIGNKCLKF